MKFRMMVAVLMGVVVMSIEDAIRDMFIPLSKSCSIIKKQLVFDGLDIANAPDHMNCPPVACGGGIAIHVSDSIPPFVFTSVKEDLAYHFIARGIDSNECTTAFI